MAAKYWAMAAKPVAKSRDSAVKKLHYYYLLEIYIQLYSPLGQQHNYNNKTNKSNSIRNNQ